MDALLFLGSGVSFKSKLPDTKSITDAIFNKKWHRHTDQAFYSGPNSTPLFDKIDITKNLQKFLSIIKEYSDSYFMKRDRSETTYEDLYYICQQIYENETNEVDNPAVQLFVDQISEKSQHLLTSKDPINRKITISSLASDSLTFT
ncbi:MAG: hypothetical protein U5R06_15800 [candidate division KSB1 bacterium]|nr:hypothetical protein [candidate division KSB1 bacterium]